MQRDSWFCLNIDGNGQKHWAVLSAPTVMLHASSRASSCTGSCGWTFVLMQTNGLPQPLWILACVFSLAKSACVQLESKLELAVLWQTGGDHWSTPTLGSYQEMDQISTFNLSFICPSLARCFLWGIVFQQWTNGVDNVYKLFIPLLTVD